MIFKMESSTESWVWELSLYNTHFPIRGSQSMECCRQFSSLTCFPYFNLAPKNVVKEWMGVKPNIQIKPAKYDKWRVQN